MPNIIISGANGKMAEELLAYSAAIPEYKTVAGIDVNYKETENSALPFARFASFDECNIAADCLIDFSHHSSANALTDYCVKNSLPCVIATTGHTDEEKELIYKAAEKIPVFFSANFSIGVNVTVDLARRAAEMFPEADIEIVETHHNRKLDVPSGTALMYLNELKKVRKNANPVIGRHENGKRERNDIGMHSVRMGNIVGIHEVLISTQSETITIRHEAQSRAVFAKGAIMAADFIIMQDKGIYDMHDLIESESGK